MKRWHVEQILYLNELNKSKLAFSELPAQLHRNHHSGQRKEKTLVAALRRFIAFFVNTL